MAKGMTIVRALMCAAKLRSGQKCSMAETAAALDTLAWAYKNRGKLAKASEEHERRSKKRYKRQSKKGYRTVKRSY